MSQEENISAVNYSCVFLTYVAHEGTICTPMVKNHMLAYVYSGEMAVEHHEPRTILPQEECFFVKRDHRISTVNFQTRFCLDKRPLAPEMLIRRRFEAAYDLLTNDRKKASDVYEEVGFKNLHHSIPLINASTDIRRKNSLWA